MLTNAIFKNNTVPVLEQFVGFTQARQEVLAGNIANLDTPGYKVRDLSQDKFESHLKQLIAQRYAPSDSPPSPSTSGLSRGRKHLESILYHDESNVSVENQVAEMSKNQIKHNTALAIMVSQFGLLHAAISERA